MSEETAEDSFTRFATRVAPRLNQALISFARDAGRDAASEPLLVGLEHSERVRRMDNPAGYLYRVGLNRVRRSLHPMSCKMRVCTAATCVALLILSACSEATTDTADVAQPASTTIAASSPTTTSPTETTSTSIQPELPSDWTGGDTLALVDRYYTALNSGDLLLARDFGPAPGRDAATGIRAFDAVYEWSCELESDVDVVCTERVEDAFYGPAGLSLQGTAAYRVTPQGVLSRTSDASDACFSLHGIELDEEFLAYVRSFDAWLWANHSDTPSWIWMYSDQGQLPSWLDGNPCRMYSVESTAVAPTIIDYVREFLAQSDEYPAPIVLATQGSVTTGTRYGETLFTLTHDPARFADLAMTRQPNGTLVTLGWQHAVWTVQHSGYPQATQLEIHRLWPTEPEIDMLWLTDYSGVTRDTLTGFTPAPSDTFKLLDALILEGDLARFGLHADCRVELDSNEVSVALLSFANDTTVPIIAWQIDHGSQTLHPLQDPTTMILGECFTPQPRN